MDHSGPLEQRRRLVTTTGYMPFAGADELAAATPLQELRLELLREARYLLLQLQAGWSDENAGRLLQTLEILGLIRRVV